MVQMFGIESRDQAERLTALVAALQATPGVGPVVAGEAVEDPGRWVLTATWQTVGQYRGALSTPEARMAFMALWSQMDPGPGAFEARVVGGADGLAVLPTDLADRDG